MSKYEIIIYWTEEDSAYIVEVPELPGCEADGETYQKALWNAEVTIKEWIETAEELGRSIQTPKGKLMYAWKSISILHSLIIDTDFLKRHTVV